MPKIVKPRWIRDYFQTRENTPIPVSKVCTDLNIGRRTLKKKIEECLDDDADLCLLCCVYHVVVMKENGDGEPKPTSQFAGGYMYYNPQTATDDTDEIIRETFDWWEATGRAFDRIRIRQFSRKAVIRLLPNRQRILLKQFSTGINGFSAGAE